MLTKLRSLLSSSKKQIWLFYNSEINDDDNNDNDNSNNYADNHNNYDNKIKFWNDKPTEDPLCSKKEKDEMVFSILLFSSTDF